MICVRRTMKLGMMILTCLHGGFLHGVSYAEHMFEILFVDYNGDDCMIIQKLRKTQPSVKRIVRARN